MEVRRQHSHYDGRRLSSASNHRMPKDRCVPSKAPLEIFVTQDRDKRKLRRRRASRRWSRLRQSVSILKITAHRNFCPHQPEEIGSDDGLPYLLGTAILSGKHPRKVKTPAKSSNACFVPSRKSM